MSSYRKYHLLQNCNAVLYLGNTVVSWKSAHPPVKYGVKVYSNEHPAWGEFHVAYSWSLRSTSFSVIRIRGIKKKLFLYFKECCYKVALLIWCVLQPSYTMLTVPWCRSEFCVLSRPDSKPLAVLLYVTFCQTVCFAWGHLVTVQDMGALSSLKFKSTRSLLWQTSLLCSHLQYKV